MIEIYLLDQNGRRQYGCRLNEAFPKTIGQVDLNAAPATEIVKLPISFAFRTWTNLDRDRSPVERVVNDVIDEATLALRRNIPASVNRLI